MNEYLGNICIIAASAIAGGAIAHLTDIQIIENYKEELEINKLENEALKLDAEKNMLFRWLDSPASSIKNKEN
jgi:hypothetical protein